MLLRYFVLLKVVLNCCSNVWIMLLNVSRMTDGELICVYVYFLMLLLLQGIMDIYYACPILLR
jgi:hypothetical protein